MYLRLANYTRCALDNRVLARKQSTVDRVVLSVVAENHVHVSELQLRTVRITRPELNKERDREIDK